MRVRRTEAEIFESAKRGAALLLKELGVASGYGYSTVRKWKAMGMPLIDGRITMRDALAWRKSLMPSELPVDFATVSHHPLLAVDKSGGLRSKSDSLGALQQPAECLREHDASRMSPEYSDSIDRGASSVL
jgi:hypothetical protein